MLTIACLLAAGWLTILLAPEIPIARDLRRYLVDAPALHLNRVGRRPVQIAGVVLLMFLVASWLGRDAMTIARLATPDVMMILASIDLSVCFDIVVTIALTWSAGRVGAAGAALRVLRRWLGRGFGARAPRTRRLQRLDVAANDDDDRRWGLAA